jgi:hypothetical protein
MNTSNEWDQADAESEKKVISKKEAAIAVAKSLGKEELVKLFESAVSVSNQGELNVELPCNRLERDCKHGKGWARLEKEGSTTWGVKTENGYRVSRPGRWTVGGNDGFSRKKEDYYRVARVKLGELFWVIALAD